MSGVLIILLLVATQRLAELAYAQHNTRRLLASGAVEIAAGHYPFFILLHGSWLVAMLLLVPSGVPIDVPLLILFVILQLMRVWVVATLGRFWTTRIITLPGAPLVARGPYRFVRHPNYLVVIGEIAVLPLVFGAWRIALVYSALNLALLAWRIRAENAALAQRRRPDDSPQAAAL